MLRKNYRKERPVNEGGIIRNKHDCVHVWTGGQICILLVYATEGLGLSVHSTSKPYPQVYNQQHKQ